MKPKKKMGRPRKGEGVKTIALSIEKGLLRRADALARRREMTRADLVDEALRDALLDRQAGTHRHRNGLKVFVPADDVRQYRASIAAAAKVNTFGARLLADLDALPPEVDRG